MEETYSKEEYSKAYTELLVILKCLPNKDLIKIPREILEFYKENRDQNHKFEYNDNLEFKEQNLMRLTMTLFANLYIKYLATEERKKEIEQQDRKELQKIENEKREKYDIEKIFEKRKEKQEYKNREIAVIEKKSIFSRIIDKVKQALKLT